MEKRTINNFVIIIILITFLFVVNMLYSNHVRGLIVSKNSVTTNMDLNYNDLDKSLWQCIETKQILKHEYVESNTFCQNRSGKCYQECDYFNHYTWTGRQNPQDCDLSCCIKMNEEYIRYYNETICTKSMLIKNS
jgi:hypothetical protein